MSDPSRPTATVMSELMSMLSSRMEGVRQISGRLSAFWSSVLDTLTMALFISVSAAKLSWTML